MGGVASHRVTVAEAWDVTEAEYWRAASAIAGTGVDIVGISGGWSDIFQKWFLAGIAFRVFTYPGLRMPERRKEVRKACAIFREAPKPSRTELYRERNWLPLNIDHLEEMFSQPPMKEEKR